MRHCVSVAVFWIFSVAAGLPESFVFLCFYRPSGGCAIALRLHLADFLSFGGLTMIICFPNVLFPLFPPYETPVRRQYRILVATVNVRQKNWKKLSWIASKLKVGPAAIVTPPDVYLNVRVTLLIVWWSHLAFCPIHHCAGLFFHTSGRIGCFTFLIIYIHALPEMCDDMQV